MKSIRILFYFFVVLSQLKKGKHDLIMREWLNFKRLNIMQD